MEELNEKTKTFAMLDDDSESSFILTNNENLTFDNLDIRKDKGWLVNTMFKTISPYLPIGVLTKNDLPWITPKRQLNILEVMKYKRIG